MYDWTQNKILTDTVEMLKETGDGNLTVTLAGSHAKGLDDAFSDIDIYLYYEKPKPYEVQKQIVESFADGGEANISRDHVSMYIGGNINFRYKGVYIDVSTRLYENALKHIHDSLEGRFEILSAPEWTFNGYYTFTYASEISIVIPMWDPSGFIENTRKLLFPYPSALKKSIIERFGQAMNHYASHWEYTRNAVERGDLFYTHHFVFHALLNMVQVIFALNDTYYTGDKQIARKLAALSYCPARLLDNLPFLLGAPDSREALMTQRDLLQAVVREVNEKIQAGIRSGS